MANRLYMVIEHFKAGDAVPVYRRFQEYGRLAPEVFSYVPVGSTPSLSVVTNSWRQTMRGS
jgi:hypothetical protein